MDSTGGLGSSGGPETEISTTAGIPGNQNARKRIRIRFSCTTCREKKLKCDRQLPCNQCAKRGIEPTCRFIPYVAGAPPRSKTAPTATNHEATMQARLRHLEQLVQVLKAQAHENGTASSSTATPEDGDSEDDLGSAYPRMGGTTDMVNRDGGYSDTSKWETVLCEITAITKDFAAQTIGEAPADKPGPALESVPDLQGPALLVGGYPPATVYEMLRYLPPRPIVDRLLTGFFEDKEPSWIILHIPTFMKHYNELWDDPTQMTYAQLGLLFAMFSTAALRSVKSGKKLPDQLGEPHDVYKAYKVRSAQCLTLSEYTKPGPYKIEALTVYFGCEYLGGRSTGVSISIVLGIIIRLALHMGLHRDPKHHPDLTPFQGEMRRRIWAVLRDLDLVVAFQFCLPANIDTKYYDTEPPRNLHDEDFDETCTALPPSRPETERTRVLWTIAKHRLINVFADLVAATTSPRPVNYAEIMRLDKQLEQSYDSFPPCLRSRSLSESITDPVDLITDRYALELTYLKIRMILHRRYMGYAYTRKGSRYSYSRRACLDAATRTLRYQYDIHCERQPGGRFASAITHSQSNTIFTHNFLLANMIICLAIYSLKEREKVLASSPEAAGLLAGPTSAEIIPKEQLLDMLRTSRSIWECVSGSAEANRALKILTKMFSVSTGETFDSSPAASAGHPGQDHHSTGADAAANSATVPTAQPSYEATSWLWSCDRRLGQGVWSSDMDISPPSNDVEGFPTLDFNADWSLWDNQIQNYTNNEVAEIPWDTFFQPGMSGV
ncbi:Activator of stress genes 1 [Madurella fahalii]|uniref:Activator of stress genes 1 n=1 Tax=Madurella fahalii TaxID=1157608 RepID=A0ABQ0GGR4_9PEZI